ncbi:MAG: CRISPR-associated helicase Cas3' [Ardenticatenaceae bacterium]|nr:CRISPR-associated helicase Cas3' [Anaerolineales bacterium]MCB9009408.1 CRISPR-associated helicase Cas3' [Ardenticatenaceae bacterium]
MSTFIDPYPYQEQVAKYLLQGKSIILQAPTGAGKTTAALLPYLHARKNFHANQFPRKCIYSVPMKVLANQFEAEYKKIIRRYGWQDDLQVRVQTGDRPDDPQFEGDLIFTTIDQTLSSFLNVPYGVGRRRANINAGAIVSSYLVFDELHLYDPDSSLPTTLQMLQMLKGITPFIIMTATFSSSMLIRLGKLLDAVVVPATSDERQAMEKIGSQVDKDRRFFSVDAPLTATAVLAHDVPRTLCICNTVQAAQELYGELASALEDELVAGTAVLNLLHARFYKTDRDAKETWIRQQFGIPQDEYNGPRLIQIATQVIEVGVDATCDVLHTELSPASSLLQRAGRCARRQGETGRVLVYLPRDEQGEPYLMPYNIGTRGQQLCDATWQALQTAEFTDQPMLFSKEQALIDAVHKPVDEQILDELQGNRFRHLEEMIKAMRDYENGRSLIPQLIRDVDNRFVFLHPNPRTDEKLATNPWTYDGFSLFPGTLAKAFKSVEAAYEMWGMRLITDDEAPSNERYYGWYPLTEANDVRKTPVITISPTIASYSSITGFGFTPSDDEEAYPPERHKQHGFQSFAYELETYAEHVTGLFQAYQQGISDGKTRYAPLHDELAFVAQRLEGMPIYKLHPNALDQMCRTLFACHDLGKLNVDWQMWAHKWQAQVGQFYDGQSMAVPSEYMAAHTRYDPRDGRQREVQKKLGRRPNHAGESAMAGLDILEEMAGESEVLFRAAVTAVARHHTPSVQDHTPYQHHRHAPLAIQAGLQAVQLPIALAGAVPIQVTEDEPLGEWLIDFLNNEQRLVYFLLVRILRLADQRSQTV